jgi:UPF0176 protein
VEFDVVHIKSLVRSMTVAVEAFYKFVWIDEPDGLRSLLTAAACRLGAKGTILIAHEGINGTISAPAVAMGELLAFLRADPRFADLVTKSATTAVHPFQRLKVKVKPEIITFRQPNADPSASVGTYVKPADWNALISAPDVTLVDTRNRYEIEAGTFEGAIDPGTRHFTEFPAFVAANLDPVKNPRVAMFCTGGIRCEKASAYLIAKGFREVYHLEGGILSYLASVPERDSRFRGDCFVFDEREGVGHGSPTDEDND